MAKYELGTKLMRESDEKVFEITHIGKETTDPKMRMYQLSLVKNPEKGMPFMVMRRDFGMFYSVIN